MGKPARDIPIGTRFGRWEVIARAGSDKRGKALWAVRCACGTVAIREGTSLSGGKSKGCRACGNISAAYTNRRKGNPFARKYITVMEE
jgi:hypothetical protein